MTTHERQTETTSKMDRLTELSLTELHQMLSDRRITLQSIYPYRCKAVSAEMALIREELARRAQTDNVTH